MRLHQRAAVRLAATIAGTDRAADAAQEGFLKAHRALDQFDPRRPFRPWLLRIVANAAKNEVRSSTRHLRLAARANEVRVELTPPSDPAVQAEERRRLLDALTSLSIGDRTIISLRWFEELSEAELAQAMNIRPGTVKSRLHRAMGRLRAALESTETNDD